MQSVRIALAALMFCALATAQAGAPSHAPEPAIQRVEIELSPDSDIFVPYSDKSPAIPKQCDGDGNPYVWLLGTGGYEIVEFTKTKAVTFGKHQVTDIPHASFGSFTVTDSGVFVLVSGIESSREEKSTAYDEDRHQDVTTTRLVGDRRQYIARFDRSGSYKGAVKLDPQRVQQLAAFPGAPPSTSARTGGRSIRR